MVLSRMAGEVVVHLQREGEERPEAESPENPRQQKVAGQDAKEDLAC